MALPREIMESIRLNTDNMNNDTDNTNNNVIVLDDSIIEREIHGCYSEDKYPHCNCCYDEEEDVHERKCPYYFPSIDGLSYIFQDRIIDIYNERIKELGKFECIGLSNNCECKKYCNPVMDFSEHMESVGLDNTGYAGSESTSNTYNEYGFNINTRLHRTTDSLYDPEGFNFDSYDEDGFGRDGYDMSGFNRQHKHRNGSWLDDNGYDYNGYNEDGYNPEGYNCKGFNCEGLHIVTGTLYDEEGYNSRGFNSQHLHRNGTPYCNGYDYNGYDRYGFNNRGYHKTTRNVYDKKGYNRYGFNRQHLHRSGSLYDSKGYNWRRQHYTEIDEPDYEDHYH
jgi:hypothetical protein